MRGVAQFSKMLAIRKSQNHRGKCTPNILSCRINHNGPVDTSERYWNPQEKDGKAIAYFRGRKLYGKQLKVPKRYKGVVGLKSERVLQPEKSQAPEDEDEEDMPEVKILEEQSSFEQVIVWGHEAVMDEADPFVRGMEEWIGLSEAINSFDVDEQSVTKS